MKTTKVFEIEIQRTNITAAAFLSYVRRRVDEKGGKYHRSDLELDYFRAGNDLNFDDIHDDGMHEYSKSKPYEMQTYIQDADGAVYNEICELNDGNGYYYLLVTECDAADADANNREICVQYAGMYERKANRAAEKAARMQSDLDANRKWVNPAWIPTRESEIKDLEKEAAENRARADHFKARAKQDTGNDTTNPAPREIVATFANGREITYTTAILPLLRTDPAVITIYDANTGEIIHERQTA